ncbi:MAG: hypothetical protein RLZZ436_3155 [Planctomycetota bacterium]
MAGFPVRLPSSEPKTRPPGSLVPRSLFLAPPHSLALKTCLAPSLAAFCLLLGEADAGSAGKQPAEENRSLTSKRQRGGLNYQTLSGRMKTRQLPNSFQVIETVSRIGGYNGDLFCNRLRNNHPVKGILVLHRQRYQFG